MKKAFIIPLLLCGGLVLTSCNESTELNITEVRLNKTYLKLTIGETYSLSATTIGGSKNVTFFSSDSSIATVNPNGVVKAIAQGEATIYASANDKIATCNVKVSNTYYEPKTSQRDGDFKISLESNDETYQLFTPITYSYRSLGGGLDTDDMKINYDIDLTKGIASETKSETEQALENLRFISYITSLDNNQIFNYLLDRNFSFNYRALGYNYSQLLDELENTPEEEREDKLASMNDEHISFGRFDDRFVLDAYSVENNVERVRYAKEETFDEDSDYYKYRDIFELFQNIKLNLNTLISIDYVTIFKNIFNDEAVIIGDDSNSALRTTSRLFAAFLYFFVGNMNVEYEATSIGGYNAASFHTYLNDDAKDSFKSIMSLAANSDYLEYVEVSDISFDFTLYQDKTVDNYNHLAKFTSNVELKILENQIVLQTELNLSPDAKEEGTEFFSDIASRQNRFNNVIGEVDRYIDKLGDVISYSDNDDRKSGISLLKNKYDIGVEAANNFASLSDNAKFVINENAFDKDKIIQLYEDSRTALNTASEKLGALTNKSTMKDVYQAIQDIIDYQNYKEALKEANSDGFDVAVTITDGYLDNIIDRIESACVSLKAIKETSKINTIKNALLDNADLFQSDGLLADILPTNYFSLLVTPAKYNENVMLTEELNNKLQGILSFDEEYDEEGTLINNLYALSHYAKEAYRIYMDKYTLAASDLYKDLSAQISSFSTELGQLNDIARTSFNKLTGLTKANSVANVVNSDTKARIKACLDEKYNNVKENMLSIFADLKVNPDTTNKGLWAALVQTYNIDKNIINGIQEMYLDSINQIDFSFLDQLVREGNALLV